VVPARSIDTEADLREHLEHIQAAMLRMEQEERGTLDAVDPRYRASARNLLHFIAFHRHRHPGLELALRQRGLSTLAGCDPHLLHTLSAVLGWLRPGLASPGVQAGPDRRQGERLLQDHCDLLFGIGDSQGGTAIMVTLPAAAAQQPGLIRDLVQAGMGIARINCAHDDRDTWRALVSGVREACAATGRHCRVAIDLAGPKLRTCGLPSLEGVIDGRPQRDRLGRLIRPFRLLVTDEGAAAHNLPADVVVLPVQGEGLEGLQRGDRLRGRDASGRWRELLVLDLAAEGIGMSCNQRCRFIGGLRFQQEGGSAWLEVAGLPPAPGELLLRQGDELRLTAAPTDAPDAVACSLPEVFASLSEGERVLFDDGRIAAVIHSVSPLELGLTITHARPRGSRLRNDKGINFPDSTLALPALTTKDQGDLAFATEHADLLGYSFVHSAADIEALQQALQRAGREDLPVVLKIETRRAFLDLPRLLLAAMRRPAPVGVMIARGDLAIECGWEDLAEIQEEILRICAAAHVPCIWATQVLEAMARTGMPTRAEITDAAMGARAEVVMLNKGPNITATVRTLREIVGRMRTGHPGGIQSQDPLLSCLSFRSNCGAVAEESLVP
jgi:pyruvate kinase